MTRRILGTLAVAVALTISLAAKDAVKTMSATGVVSSVSASSVTIEGKGKTPMMFMVDSSTKLLARGATAKTKEKGAAGLQITDMVKQGNQVTIKYTKTGDQMHAMSVSVAAR
jgi:hypothetical protein